MPGAYTNPVYEAKLFLEEAKVLYAKWYEGVGQPFQVTKVEFPGTPDAFDVLRVKVVLVRTIGVLPSTTIRTFAFVTECYGTVATVTSKKDDANEEFTVAAEIRRIAP